MPTCTIRLTCRVETTKICNQSTKFRLWWVDGGLEFSQLASGGLDKNIDFYPPNLTRIHPYCLPLIYLTLRKMRFLEEK